MKKYFKLSEKQTELNTLRTTGIPRGKYCGLESLDEYFSLKLGYPIFIGGAPHSGKTEFTLDIALNAAIMHSHKSFVYVGEGGDVEDAFAELVSKHAQKPYLQSSGHFMDESQRTASEMFVNDHFIVANPDVEFTIESFLEAANEAEQELGIKFQMTIFDPFNDAVDESNKYGNRDDKYLNHVLKKIRKSSKVNKRIDIAVTHIADIKPAVDSDTGRRYTPVALATEWAGGRTWQRRAFQQLLVYRPPSWLKDENGRPFKENECHIYIQKSKPKGVGKMGMAKIYFDWKRNRYYCYSKNGQRLYSTEKSENYSNQFPIKQSAIKPDIADWERALE